MEEQPGNQDEAFMNVTKTHKVSPVHLKVVNNVFPLNILIKKHPYTAMQRIMALLFHPPPSAPLLSQSHSTAMQRRLGFLPGDV